MEENKEKVQQEEDNKETTSETNILDEAKEVLLQLRKENDRSEAIAATNLISGKGAAGVVPKKSETEEEKLEREAKEIIDATGLTI